MGFHMNNKITSEAFADLIIENNSISDNKNAENITFVNDRHSILNIPVENINKCSIGTYPFQYFPKCYTLQSTISLEKSGVTRIQNNPNLALLGQGVLIGIIDTGIDYQHEAFLQNSGNTKIVSIWDQSINEDTLTSENILYGKEFNREMINEALSNDNPLTIVPSVDEIGHGTMIAGIIVGNESLENNFRGVVPNAELVIVKLKQAKRITKEMFAIPKEALCYQETDILLGLNYLIKIARQLEKPMVICIALGTNQGSHDNRGALNGYLSYLTDNQGFVIIIAGGNEGNSRRHYLGTINSVTKFNDFELNVGKNENGFTMEIWQNTPFRLSMDIKSPAGEYINPILPTFNDCRRISFIFETTNIYVNNLISEQETGDQLILVRFEFPTEGIWRFRITNLDGLASTFNVWLPSGELITESTYLISSNPDTTLTSPANAFYPITITAYNHMNDSIWINSSRGYTRTETIKPDLAAPGVEIVCPLVNNKYGTVSGTGAAAAHASGIAGMLQEWGIVRGKYPDLSGTEIRKILIRGAKRDPQLTYPNNIWGYGIIDVYETFNRLG